MRLYASYSYNVSNVEKMTQNGVTTICKVVPWGDMKCYQVSVILDQGEWVGIMGIYSVDCMEPHHHNAIVHILNGSAVVSLKYVIMIP